VSEAKDERNHLTGVHWGDYHVFAYCMEPDCTWEGERTNEYWAHRTDHRGIGLAHTKHMNRWWRRFTNQEGDAS